MDDRRFGSAVRKVRLRRGWSQAQLAAKARCSQATISRIERGHAGTLSVNVIRRVAAALDMRVELTAWWRAGDLDRLLNAGHSQFHEDVAGRFRKEFGDWLLAPEVSFSIYGERGVIDILAFNPRRRALLVIELKTDIADINELVGGVDRKRRLARAVATERGWDADTVSVWVIATDGRTNRRRLDAHRMMLRAAFPLDGRRIGAWLRDPSTPIAALSTWTLPETPHAPRNRRRVATAA